MSRTDQQDYAGRQAQNAIFGDAIVAERIPDVIMHFAYGVASTKTTQSVTGTGAISEANAAVTVSSGAGVGTSDIISDDSIRYHAGFDNYALFTAAFSAGDAGSYQWIGPHDANNGYAIGQEEGVFKLLRRSGGADVEKITIDIDAMAWNEFDTTKLNIFRVNYGYLGVAPDIYEVYAGADLGWQTLGTMEVLNEQAIPSIELPVLPITAEAGRTSGSGAVTITTASWSGGRIGPSGERHPNEISGSLSNSKAAITTELNILTLRSKATLGGITNRVRVHVDLFTMACDGTKITNIRVVKNAALWGTPVYNDYDTATSVIEYDVAGTTVTGGDEEVSIQLGKVDSDKLDVSTFDIFLDAGDTVTISGTSANATEAAVSVRWHEER